MERILRLPEVKHRTGLARSTIYSLIETGEFPRQIQLATRSVGWLESEVDDWLNARIAASRYPDSTVIQTS